MNCFAEPPVTGSNWAPVQISKHSLKFTFKPTIFELRQILQLGLWFGTVPPFWSLFWTQKNPKADRPKIFTEESTWWFILCLIVPEKQIIICPWNKLIYIIIGNVLKWEWMEFCLSLNFSMSFLFSQLSIQTVMKSCIIV